MKKIIFLLLFIVFDFSFMYAGTWIIGKNQVDDLLSKIEKGTGEAPPATPANTDLENWENLDWVTITASEVQTTYMEHNNTNHWRGIVSIDFADKGYKQKEGTIISFIQPSLDPNDYSSTSTMSDYCDKNDLSWLENLNLSGNDFHAIEIDGSEIMPLKTVDLSNNANLQSFSIINCKQLESLNISGCNLTIPKIASITKETGDATVNYAYQGKISYYYAEVDLTELLSDNGGASVQSWSAQPESSSGSTYIFNPDMAGKIVSVTLINDNYPGIAIKYDIELLESNPVRFNLDTEFTAIEVENYTNPGKQIVVGDEVFISVYPFSCTKFKSFKIDDVETTLDANNQYRLTATKSKYNLSGISEEIEQPNRLTTNYLKNGSFEQGLNLDWEYFVGEDSNATFSLLNENKIYDGGNVGLKVDVNSIGSPTSVYARTRVTVGCDSLYLLQFWANGPEEAELYVTIEGAEQPGILYGMRIGNEDSKGRMVAYHYPFKVASNNYKKELVITFYFRSDVTNDKSNDVNNCYITSHAGATYYLDGLVLVDQNNDMQHDVYNTYLWNYNQVPNKGGQSWTAGDNDVSFDLPDGRRMWFFNDSFYGANHPETNIFQGGSFVRNAAVIQELDGSLHALPTTMQNGQSVYFRIPDEDTMQDSNGNWNCLWVGDALIEDDQVKVYLIEVYGKDRSYIGKFSYPELEFIGIEEQEAYCRTYEKFFVEGNYIYLYANKNEDSGWSRNMTVARAELGDLSGKKGTWRFWDGTGWNTEDQKYKVSTRGADDVIKLGEGNYAQLAMPTMSPEVYVRFASSPQGPFEHEVLVGIGDQSANYWYYMPNFHGQLLNGKYSMSMSANYFGCLFGCQDCENKLFVDKYWYRARYIQADLLALSPFTTNKKDCANVVNGEAYFDECGDCVGGTTGLNPCLTGIAGLYSNADYSGGGIGLNTGEYTSSDLIDLGLNPNTLSSFMLDEGYVIELYADDNFQGNRKLFESGVENLAKESFDNQTNSLIIRRKGLENLKGTYTIQNKQSELYMSIQGKSTANGAAVVQETATGGNDQKFVLEYIGNGYYTLTNGKSGKTLSIAEQSVEVGSYAEQWDGNEIGIAPPEGVISTQYSDSPTGEGKDNLMDGNVNTKYLTFHSTCWVQFEASVPYILERYTITSANDAPVRDPQSWTLSGSNNGSDWITLDTQSGISFTNRFEEQSFAIEENKTAYTYYRLNMTCASGTTLQLSEWKLFAYTEKSEGEYFDSQKFVIQDAGDGYVKIINKKSDMLLEILDGFMEEGVKVWQNSDLGQLGVLWKLRETYGVSIPEPAMANNNIIVYPNPVSDAVTIEAKTSGAIERINIVDLSGKTIFNNTYNTDRVVITLSDWNKGIYIVKVYIDNGSYTHKMIKI